MLCGGEGSATAWTGKARDSGVQTTSLQHMLWWHFHVQAMPGHAQTLPPPKERVNQNLKVTLCTGPAGELLSAPFGKQRGDRLLPLGQYLVLLPQGYCQDSCVPLGFIPGGWYFCWWCHHLLADFLQQRAKLWPKPLVAPAALCDSGANICLMNYAVRRRDSSLPRSILLCPAHGNTPEGGPQAPRLSLYRTGCSNRLQTRGEEGKWEGAFGSVGLGDIYRGPQPRAGWGTEAPLRKFP